MNFAFDIRNKDEVIKWLNEIKKGTGDARPLWIAVTPKLIEFVNYEFHNTRDSHKIWPILSTKYMLWKVRHHYPIGIGVLTGKMREAAAAQAVRKIEPKSLAWQLNEAITVSKNGYNYSQVFDKGNKKGTQPARKIYKYTALRLNSFLAMDVKKFNSGASHNSFTYNWLRRSLEPN